jgi:hypothetical protein
MSDLNGSAAAGNPDNGGAPASGADWTAELDEATRGFVQTKGWKAPANIIESYRNLERMTGDPNSVVRIPGSNATDADWDAFYGRLGRPNGPDGYDFGGDNADEATDNWLREKAHSLGLTQQQAAKLRAEVYGLSAQRMEEARAAATQALEQTTAELRREWGNAFDEKEALAQSALDYFAGSEEAADELKAKLVRAGLMDANMVRGLVRLGEALSEDGNGRLIGRGDGSGLTPAEAKQKIADLRRDPEFMKDWLDSGRPGHKEAVQRMEDLHKALV